MEVAGVGKRKERPKRRGGNGGAMPCLGGEEIEKGREREEKGKERRRPGKKDGKGEIQ